jgi:hypothetical protein
MTHSGRRSMPHHRESRVEVPLIGATISVPPPEKLAFYAGLGVLAAVELLDWPLALVLAGGHFLADQHYSQVARGIGEAVEET